MGNHFTNHAFFCNSTIPFFNGHFPLLIRSSLSQFKPPKCNFNIISDSEENYMTYFGRLWNYPVKFETSGVEPGW